MNICIIVNEYPPDQIAGTAMATQALAVELVKKGIGVHVIVTERLSGSARFSTDSGAAVIRLSNSGPPMIRWILRILKIRRTVSRILPDILHGQSISCGLYALFAGRMRNIPVVTSIQGLDFYEATRIQKKTEIRCSLIHSNRVTAVTKGLAQACKPFVGGNKIRIIPHGFVHKRKTDEIKVTKKGFGISESTFVLFCAARLRPIKGVDVLLRAMTRLPELKLWIAGDGPEYSYLEWLCEELGISEKVDFLGLLEHEEIFRRMEAADLFILPSRMESFGICLLEAMDVGLPIVATRVGGIPEIVGDENGILVPPEDPAALASAIESLRQDIHRRTEMSKRNQEKAKFYHWQDVADQYIAVYRDAFSNG